MKRMRELSDILEKILKKRPYRHLSHEKVEVIFRSVSLNEPDKDFSPERVLARIRADMPRAGTPAPRPLWQRPSLAAAALLFLVFSFFTARSFIQQDAPGVRLLPVRGRAHIVKAGTGDREKQKKIPLTGEFRIAAGEGIETGAGSSVDVFMGGEVILRAGEKSRLVVKNFQHTRKDYRLSLYLERGSLIAAVKKQRKKDIVTITTDNSVTQVRGTLFSVKINEKGLTQVNLYEGKLQVSARTDGLSPQVKKSIRTEPVFLHEGQFCRIAPPGRAKAPVPPVAPLNKVYGSEEKNLAGFARDHDKKLGRKALQAVARYSHVMQKGKVVERGSDRRSARYVFALDRQRGMVKVREDGVVRVNGAQRILWQRRAAINTRVRPVMKGNSLYFALDGGKVGKLFLENGTMAWERGIDGGPVLSLLSGGKFIYLAAKKGHFYCLKKDGSFLWKNSAERAFTGISALTDCIYFAALEGGGILGFDRLRGIKVIRKKYSGRIVCLSVHGSRVYIVTASGRVTAYNYRGDEEAWKRDVQGSPVTGCTAAGDGLFLFQKKGAVTRINQKGAVAWKRETGGPHMALPRIDGERVYILTRELFIVLNRRTGMEEWTLVVPPVVKENFGLTGDHVFFFSRQKGLHVLKK